ncbi:hypothetical protein [Microvirga roseola]|uniref:hypothetical protein n=1 Tax=Microvirga roseola TaxID=2883126 RepID=UPI001E5C8D34|nr:hypothetical protein [Microvirga roseola]
MARDPRSDAEKARADLARNSELGLAVPESPAEQQPSLTPETFADTTEDGRARANEQWSSEQARASADIGDSTGTMATSRDIPPSRETVKKPPTHRSDESDGVLPHAKE